MKRYNKQIEATTTSSDSRSEGFPGGGVFELQFIMLCFLNCSSLCISL